MATRKPARKQISEDRRRSYDRDDRGRFDASGRADQRRAMLISAAAKLFAEHGYHGTSMADLTEAADLRRGGVYHYIDSKVDLLFMIHEQVITPLEAEIRTIDKQRLSPPDKLRAFARALMRNIASQPAEVTVFFHEWRTMIEEPQWKQVREKRRYLERTIERTFERGVADGSLRVKNTRLAFRAFLNLINYSYTWFDPDGEWSFEEVADEVCEMFLRGVLSPADD